MPGLPAHPSLIWIELALAAAMDYEPQLAGSAPGNNPTRCGPLCRAVLLPRAPPRRPNNSTGSLPPDLLFPCFFLLLPIPVFLSCSLSLSQVHERRHGRCLEFLPLPKTRPRSDPPPRTRSRPPPLLPLLCFEEEDVAASIHVSASLRVDTAVTWAAWLALLPTEPSRPIFSSPSTQPPACLYPLCRRAKAHGCRCR
ncbi:uncharacterized protein LOC125533279 [Triticum urartu]|uniref:Uncharacterized protein n=1 Tax=Triticum urartu TaxID=4572 RepID=A0A8R7K0F2_TRIUA|nr:uncharacterized protein LOC125533279 [Triticum urartu]